MWQPFPILRKVFILIAFTIMIPFLLAALAVLTFCILLYLVFVIPANFFIVRWGEIMLGFSHFNKDDMKVPTFSSMIIDDGVPVFFIFPVVGAIFGGIHCVGWSFNFPSRDEAILWQVSSAVLTSIAFLLPLLMVVLFIILDADQLTRFGVPVNAFFLLVYIVSRLLLLVEAFISLRHLTPGMLALVKWTSFIPHI